MADARSLTIGLIAADSTLAAEVRAALSAPDVQLLFERPDTISMEDLQATLLRLRPDVLLINAQFSALSEGVAAMPGAPDVIAIHGTADPDLILSAMRAGIREFVYSPVAQRLTESLVRIRRNRADSGGCCGRMLAFVSAKGGCGSTTVSCHAAAELARTTRERVLLADLDPNGGAVGFLMNSKSPYNLEDAIENTNRLDPSYWEALVSNGYPNLEVIQSAPPSLAPAPLPDRPLREVLRFMRVQYPWTVLDLSRASGCAVWGTLDSADSVFLVSTVDLVALHQARLLVTVLGNAGITSDRIRLILNRVPKNPLVTPQEIEATLGIELYSVLPEDAEALAEAHSSRKLAGGTSLFGRQIARMIAKLNGHTESVPKRRFSLFS